MYYPYIMDNSNYLQRIFQAHFTHYAKKHSLPLKQHKAAYAIMNCKTEALGSSVYECNNDHTQFTLYHSCRHRSCPQCAAKRQHAWLEKQQRKLLNCAHFHSVFSLPHEYLDLWQYNSKWFTQCLFQSAKNTILELLADQKHLGATPGIIMVLHTWGRQLNQHPHLHCIVSAGGISKSLQWVDKKAFLFPIKAAKCLYRGKVQAALKQALKNDELSLPPNQSKAKVNYRVNQLYKKPWAIHIEPPYAYGDGVIKYLSRYISGGPLKAQQITYLDTKQVHFHYKDHRDGRIKQLNLKMDEFIRRILWHVADMRTHQVRHYGLYATASKLYTTAVKAVKQVSNSVQNKSVKNDFFDVKCQLCHTPMRLICVTQGWAVKRISLLISRKLNNHGQSVQQDAERRRLETVPP